MNVILIVVDTLRADHLGCYGHGRDTSPALDALAAEGTLFESFWAPCIPTHPGFTTIFTGVHGVRHGIVSQGRRDAALPPEFQTLPTMLRGHRGLNTVAVDSLVALAEARSYNHSWLLVYLVISSWRSPR